MTKPTLPTEDTGDEETGLTHYGDTGVAFATPTGERAPLIYTSLPAGTMSEKLDLYDTMSAEAVPLADVIGEVIPVRDVLVHWITREQADPGSGEVLPVELKRIVLVSDDGTLYQAVSKGVLSSIGKLIQIVGFPPYVPAIPMVAATVKTSSGVGRAIILRRAPRDARETGKK